MGWRANIGLVVPSSNRVCEQEFHKMAPEGVSIHTSRMLLVDVEKLSEMPMETAVKLVATAEPDLIVYACFVGSLLGGPGYDMYLSKKIEELTGIPALTAATAVLEAIKTLNIKRIAVILSNDVQFGKVVMNFLQGNGFEVSKIKGLGIIKNVDTGKLPSHFIYRVVKEVDTPDSKGILIGCTNVNSIDIIEKLEKDLDKPVISVTQAAMWAALKRLKISDVPEGCGSLFKY